MRKKIIIVITIILFITIIFSWFFIRKTTNLELPVNVVSSTPKNNTVFVNEKSEIVLNLNRTITNKEGENLKIEIYPSTKTEIVYQINKIRISPETEFNINTQYKIDVSYKNNLIYSLSFKTNPFTKEQIREEGGKQTEGDFAFNESYNKFLTDFPWYINIPIEKKDYTIVYDFELKSFRIIMNRKIIDNTDKDTISKAAINDLIKIGVKLPIKNYVFQEIAN